MQSIKINEILHDVSLKKTLNLEACVNVYCFGQGILTLTQHSGEKEIILTSQYYLCSFFFFFFWGREELPSNFWKKPAISFRSKSDLMNISNVFLFIWKESWNGLPFKTILHHNQETNKQTNKKQSQNLENRKVGYLSWLKPRGIILKLEVSPNRRSIFPFYRGSTLSLLAGKRG